MYRARFRPSVIAELMPPLLPDGRSELWEYLGRNFTDLSYQEADKLSKTNKEFITALFPQTPIYASLLPKEVQALIGEVGEETRGVRRMLEAIGFQFSERIDPFDGGPHFEALTDQITLVQGARHAELEPEPLPDDAAPVDDRGLGSPSVIKAIVGRGESEGPCRFRAAQGVVRVRDGKVQLTREVRSALKAKTGAVVWWVPLP
jgi:arginine N-succinyltransferase